MYAALRPLYFFKSIKIKPNPGLHLRQTATMSFLFKDVASLVTYSGKHFQKAYYLSGL
jgi:hypothetical protein|uniref:Uncharacterized protein n=1 Tax=Mus musculus TaxID=10090 RepID=Q3UR40_MOUSE|nr:unnamed protein product [Mus musculus]BAE24848.1 unnamed protein product [Mus musculus]